MRNITVTVPDDVYKNARVRAAEQGRSVSSLVAEYLAGLGAEADRFADLLAQQRRVQRRVKSFSAHDRLSRDEVHDRAVR
jgi:plasmid stability protein